MPRVYSRRNHMGAEKPPSNAVYVGRPTQFGNPFIVGRHGTRDECIALYREWLKTPEGQVIARRAREQLRGKDLVCWCAPDPCHADVLLEIANG